MSISKKIVLVVGATGNQGGGVVDTLLKQGQFTVRGLTRSPNGDAAAKLTARGVEVIQGDLSDKASLAKAMAGVHGVFLVTDSYRSAGGNPEKEFEFGKTAIDAAQEAGVQHFVWSALEDVRKTPGVKDKLPELAPGRYVPHFEAKGEITEYLETSGLPHTVLLTSCFFDNWLGTFPFNKQEDGSFAFYSNVGHKKIPIHAVGAIGDTTAEVLSQPDKYIGKTVPVTAEYASFDDVAAAVSDVTGQTLKFVDVPLAAAAAAGYPGAEDIANMFEYYKQFDTYAELRPVDGTPVKTQPLSEWASANKDALKARFN